jgi:hypothetical protein
LGDWAPNTRLPPTVYCPDDPEDVF